MSIFEINFKFFSRSISIIEQSSALDGNPAEVKISFNFVAGILQDHP